MKTLTRRRKIPYTSQKHCPIGAEKLSLDHVGINHAPLETLLTLTLSRFSF